MQCVCDLLPGSFFSLLVSSILLFDYACVSISNICPKQLEVTALMEAAGMGGDIDCVRLLLAAGAEKDAVDLVRHTVWSMYFRVIVK